MNITTAQKIRELKDTIPSLILQKHFELVPELRKQYIGIFEQLYLENTRSHLSYLAESISVNEPVLFNEYLGWAKILFANLPIDENNILLNLNIIREMLETCLAVEQSNISTFFLNNGIEKFKSQNPVLKSFNLDSNPLHDLANNYLELLVKGNKIIAIDLIMKEVSNGTSIKDIYLKVFQITQLETGRLWQTGIINVAQEHFITAVTQLIMSQLYPYIFTTANKSKKIIVACVAGELHEIGARMVADLFEMEGWNSYYFGANTPLNSLINAVETYRPDVLAISVTMTFNLNNVTELIKSVKSNPKINNVKIFVGGYPFNLADKLWEKMGADGFALDAVGALNLASALLY